MWKRLAFRAFLRWFLAEFRNWLVRWRAQREGEAVAAKTLDEIAHDIIAEAARARIAADLGGVRGAASPPHGPAAAADPDSDPADSAKPG